MEEFPPVMLYPNVVITAKQFELIVMRKFQESFPNVEVIHRENIKGLDGEFNIDISIRFQELGVNFLTLVECKHHRNPIKRDYVQLLKDKVESIGAQKGILVSSSSFQKGALEYAKAHNIALIRLVNEEFMYQRRSREFIFRELDSEALSGAIVMKWIESTGETSLNTKVIDSFKDIFSISVQ